jgi:CheY-like chemotaxis protein
MNQLREAVILLIEDDVGDQKLIRQSLESGRIANELYITRAAEEALEYLQKSKNNNAEYPLPDLILLDLYMPGMGGMNFLSAIKKDELLDTIPVVVLTTSDSDQDILESFKLQASGYVKKPVSLEEFRRVMESLTDYWFVICRRIEPSRDSKYAKDTSVVSR